MIFWGQTFMKNFINSAHINEITHYYHRNFTKERIFNGHRHETWEITYMLSGELEFILDDSVYNLTEGDIVIIEPNTFHKFHVISSEIAEFIILQFVSHDLLVPNENLIYNLTFNQKVFWRYIIEEIETFEQKSNVSLVDSEEVPYSAKALLEAFLLIILKHSPNPKPISLRQYSLYNLSLNYMKKNVTKNLSIADIAQHCNVCQTTIKNVYSSVANCGVSHFFMALKIEKAKQLLQQPNSIIEISEILNFSSQGYFTKIFKKFTGMTPRQFQKLNSTHKM